MSHYYDRQGNAHHFVPKKSGSGNRPTTITDARANDWLPGVSQILSILNKPQLERWKMLQACSAVLTSPRLEGEGLDAFMNRVLFEDEEQKEEAKAAADKGTAVHDAIANALQGKPVDAQWRPYIDAAFPIIQQIGKVVWVEKVLVSEKYAGRADTLLENERNIVLLDLKTARTIPEKGSWTDHKIQTSMYAACLGNSADKHIITANLYLSTTNPGKTALFIQEDWRTTYEEIAVPLVKVWYGLNGFGGVA